jgi:hypothetical protein
MNALPEPRRQPVMAAIVDAGIDIKRQFGLDPAIAHLRAHGVPPWVIYRVLGTWRRRSENLPAQ